jgi:adenylate kinase family enzyme
LWVSLKIFEEEDADSDKVQTKIRRVLRQRQVIPDTIMAAIYSASGKSAAKEERSYILTLREMIW